MCVLRIINNYISMVINELGRQSVTKGFTFAISPEITNIS